MFGVLYQAVYRFFTVFSGPLNKGEKDQPPPLDVQRKHLQKELMHLDRQIAEREEQIRKINTDDGRE